jgi:hypothetical protein
MNCLAAFLHAVIRTINIVYHKCPGEPMAHRLMNIKKVKLKVKSTPPVSRVKNNHLI